MFEAHILTRANLDRCEALRRAGSGDELALARTHRDANDPLPRLFALLRRWFSAPAQMRHAEHLSKAGAPSSQLAAPSFGVPS